MCVTDNDRPQLELAAPRGQGAPAFSGFVVNPSGGAGVPKMPPGGAGDDMNDLTFKGWWAENEKRDAPDPWETFTIAVHGEEAGELAFEGDGLEEVLAASGYRIKLEKVT